MASSYIFRNDRDISFHERAQEALLLLLVHIINPHFIILFMQFHVIPRRSFISSDAKPYSHNAWEYLSAAIPEHKGVDNMPFLVHYQP